MARAKSKVQQKPVVEPAIDPVNVDDIELLNMYRYPHFYSDQENNRVRNSRSAQKRLEELLREMPERKFVRGKSGDATQETVEIQMEMAARAGASNGNGREESEAESENKDFLSSIKNLFQKLLS